MGLSVSRKVGGAVRRNRVRRRLREIFRSTRTTLPGGADIVVSARPAAAEAAFEELYEEFVRALVILSRRLATKDAAEGA